MLQGRPVLRGMAEWTRQRGAGQWAKGDVTPASSDSPGFFLFLPNPHLPNPAGAGGLLSVRPSGGTTRSPERQDYLPRRESWPCGDWFSFSALLWRFGTAGDAGGGFVSVSIEREKKNQMILGVNIPISLPAKFLPSVFPRPLCMTSWTHLWDTTDRTETWQGGLPCAFSRK